MIWTSNRLRWPEGIDDDRMLGGMFIDANGVRYGPAAVPSNPFYGIYVDTETGLVREAVMVDGQVQYDEEAGVVKYNEYKLAAPIRLFDRNGQEILSLQSY
jgi:hypothetical protein